MLHPMLHTETRKSQVRGRSEGRETHISAVKKMLKSSSVSACGRHALRWHCER